MSNRQLQLYLASASPRRQEILSGLGIVFDVLPQDVDESPQPEESPRDLVTRLSAAKVRSALTCGRARDPVPVLGADTVVVCGDRVLGKPSGREAAVSMLSLLSGREHEVITAVAVGASGRLESVTAVTRVRFRPLTDAVIDAYWQCGEPADKAGAYAIQGLGAMFVEGIEGSYSNVVGLPVFETVGLLESFGFGPEDILRHAGRCERGLPGNPDRIKSC